MADDFDISELAAAGPRLIDEHRAYLAAHAVDVDLAISLGVRSAIAPDDLPEPFITYGVQAVPSIVFPWTLNGSTWLQLKLMTPIERNGDKPISYLFEKGAAGPLWLAHDPPAPQGTLLVEGTKQTLAVASLRPNYRVVGMGGCEGWSHDQRPASTLALLSDRLPLIAIIDADMTTNPMVWDAAEGILRDVGIVTGASSVAIARTPGRGVTGVDDYLAGFDVTMRARMLGGLLASATNKIGRRPSGKKMVPEGLPAMLFGSDGTMNPVSVAVWLDHDRPYAVGLDFTTLYRYDPDSGLYSRELNLGAVLAGVLGDDIKRLKKGEVADGLVAQAQHNGRVIGSTLDVTRLIAVDNGLLDPDTGELVDPDPDQLVTTRWPVRWDPAATCPTIMAYLAERMPEQVDAFLDTACRMLDRDRTAQDRVLFLFGPKRSGKSTALSLLEKLVGPEAKSAVTLHQLATRPFAAAQLAGKALNVAADLSSDLISDGSTFKALTGGDPVQVERKHEHGFDMHFTGLMAFSANVVPPMAGDPDADLARIVPIACPISFFGEEDEGVKQLLWAELPGLLVELVRRHQLSPMPKPLPVVVAEFRGAADRVAAYTDTRLERCDVPAGARATQVYTDFKTWLFENGYGQPMPRPAFYRRLASLGIDHRRSGDDGAYRVGARIAPAGRQGEGFTGWVERVTERGEDSSEGSSEGPEEPSPEPSERSSLLTHVRETRKSETPYAISGLERSERSGGPLPIDLETRDQAELHDGRSDFVRLVIVGDRVTAGTDVSPILDRLRVGGAVSAHNGFAFDFEALRQTGLDVIAAADRRQLVDTLIVSILADPPMVDFGRSGTSGRVMRYHGLDQLSPRLGGPTKAGDLKRLARRYATTDDPTGFGSIPVDLPEYLAYAKRDGEMQTLVTDHLELDEYGWREMALFARLAHGITHTGFRVNEAVLAERLAQGQCRREERTHWLIDHHGLPTTRKDGKPAANAAGTEAGREAILAAFEALGLKRGVFPRTKAGNPSIGKDAMAMLLEELDDVPENADARVLAEVVLDLNGIRSVYGTVAAHLRHGRVHPSVLPLQASGRLSVQKPGLTVMGKRLGKHVERDVFLPDEGDVILAVDLNQIDARAVAGHAQDPGYLALFSGEHDIHTATAIEVLGDAWLREEAKALNHGVNYGMRAARMVEHAHKVGATGVTIAMAQHFLDEMDRKYPRLAVWKDEVREQAGAGLLLDNGFGRKMRATDNRAYTQAPALMGQGGARDLMMECVLRLPLDIVPMLRAIVHDELVFSVPAADFVDVRDAVLATMTFEWAPPGASDPVPIEAGALGPGSSWGAVYAKH